KTPTPYLETENGKRLHKRDLISQFLAVAFSEEIWKTTWKDNSHIQPFEYNYREDLDEEDRSKRTRFFANPPFDEYAFRDDDLPRHNTLQRWEDNVDIGFFLPGEYQGLQNGMTDHRIDEIRSYISEFANQISDATGLQIQLADSDAESTNTRIRIVLLENNLIQNYFKAFRVYTGGSYSLPDGIFHFSYEGISSGLTEFTPNALSQVDGYLIPEADNRLGYAVCKIFPYSEAPVLKALIGECLLRSMGLPSRRNLNGRHLLSIWNKSHDEYSLRDTIHGSEASISQNKSRQLTLQNFSKSYPSHLTDMEMVPDRASSLDLALLAILYCQDLKSGMDKYQTIKALTKSNNCVEKTLRTNEDENDINIQK
ncbi:MAG: hypothetical protein AAFU69_02350, partial [Pseudomonadota bacterium]